MAFPLIIFSVVLFLLVLAVKKEGFGYLKSKTGKGILFGLFGAPLLAVLIGMLGGCARVEVSAGIEQTKNLSPMCKKGGASDRITSNIAVRGCTVEIAGQKTYVCGGYRHHSCAISEDDSSYDAFGIEVIKEIWAR